MTFKAVIINIYFVELMNVIHLFTHTNSITIFAMIYLYYYAI